MARNNEALLNLNLDFQLINARQKYGGGNNVLKIRQETTKFTYDESLFTLCIFGGGLLSEIRMKNCYFEGMPLDGNNNFFLRLVKAAFDGSEMQQIVPIIEFEFCQPIPFPYFGENCAKFEWKCKRGKWIGTQIIKSRIDSRTKYQLICTSSHKKHGISFNKFLLIRIKSNKTKIGLALTRLKKYIFGWRKSRKEAKFWEIFEESSKDDDESEKNQNCILESESKLEANSEENFPSTSNNFAEKSKKPMPAFRLKKAASAKINTAECGDGICVPGQYQCQVHLKRLKGPAPPIKAKQFGNYNAKSDEDEKEK